MEGRQEGKINIKINKGQIITEKFRKELRITFFSSFSLAFPALFLFLSFFMVTGRRKLTRIQKREKRNGLGMGRSGRKK